MAVVENYAREFMEVKKRFESVGFELVGSRTDSGVIFYFAKERKKES